jgi:hypothetical protein
VELWGKIGRVSNMIWQHGSTHWSVSEGEQGQDIIMRMVGIMDRKHARYEKFKGQKINRN